MGAHGSAGSQIGQDKFVGYYHDAPVYENPRFNNGAGMTTPPNGIRVGQGVYISNTRYNKS